MLRYAATLMYCAALQRFWGSMQHAKAVYETDNSYLMPHSAVLPGVVTPCSSWLGGKTCERNRNDRGTEVKRRR